MKRIILLFLVLLPTLSLAQQVNFEDDFSDGDFSTNPTWSGADSNFTIASLDGNQVLRLNADGSGSSYISTVSTNAVGYWEFFVRLDFSPSNNNFTQIFLMSDIADLSGAVNGYALRAGENLSGDVFRLFKITNGAQDGEILTGTTNISSGGEYRIKVTRDASGNWNLEVAEGYNGSLAQEATGTDNTYTTTSFFGLHATYTSSNTKSFYYDFKINQPPVVVEPLFVDSFTQVNNSQIDISFTKDVDPASISTSDFILNPSSVNPASFTLPSSDLVRLTFDDSFSGGENQLSISGISDLAGDTALADTSFSFFLFDTFENGDVVINEFMKDPSPGAAEYIELKNTSSKYLNLKNWKVGDNNTLTTPSNSDLVLYPDNFVVFTTDTSALTSSFGSGYYVRASLPALNNTSDQVRVYNAQSAMVDSLQYETSWGGLDVALERRTSSVTGTIVENWGDSPSPLFGTPGKTNAIKPDTTAPEIKALIVVDRQELILVFTEAVKADSVESLSNYELYRLTKASTPNIPNLVSATLFAPDSVSLKFDPPLDYSIANYPDKLGVQHVEDIFGNISRSLAASFVITKIDTAASGDVVINEFMYDPADDYSEYIELYINQNSTFNLKNWTLSDNSGSHKVITTEDFIFQQYNLGNYPAKRYLLLLPDSTLIKNFGVTNAIVMGSRFPSLNNTTDAIVIRNEFGDTIDSLTYSSSWGGKDIALERIDANLPSTLQANWGDSPSPALGTPGEINDIKPDSSGPELLSTEILSQSSVKLTFDQFLDKEKAETPANYSLSPSISIQAVSVQDAIVTITFSSNLVEGESYILTIQDQSDIFGNTTLSQTTELRYLEFIPAAKADIVINEILFKKANEDGPEFVELFNRSNKNIDLGGWQLKDAANNKATLPAGTIITSGEFLVLTDKQNFASSLSNGLYLSSFPSLNDAGDAVVIKTAGGLLIDSLYYNSSWGGNNGISIERKDPFAASNDASNWASSTAEGGTSAGAVSSQRLDDTEAPTVIFASQTPTGLFVAFSEFISIKSDTRFIAYGAEVDNFQFDSTQANTILLLTSQSKQKADESNFEAINLYDVKGNKTASITQQIAQPLEQGTIVINEILYDPLADADDNLPDQTEYIELYNPQDYAISLEGLVLTDAPDEDGEVSIIEPVSSNYKWIPPGGFMLMYSEDKVSTFEDSRIASYFELERQSDQFTIRVDRSSLSLSATNDAIYIADSTGAVIDSVAYDESWQNPNRASTKGVALEKIDPLGPSNEPSNWSSSTDSRGGTPGSQNSIYQSPNAPEGSTGITFSSNPFSPDDDGFEDNLFINYELDQADYLLRVRIFDRYGRKVRTLTDGKAAGFSGSLIWDGLTDDRNRNRVGIYIILFEAYNSASGKKKTFKETVVLAKMF